MVCPSRSTVERELLARAGRDDRGDVRPLVHGRAVDCRDHVAGLKARQRGGRLGVTRGTFGLARRWNAHGHLGHRRGGLGRADRGEDEREREDREHEVNERAAEHHDDLAPPGEVIERAVVLAVEHLVNGRGARVGDDAADAAARLDRLDRLLRRNHADEPHEPTERNRLDAVLGLLAHAGTTAWAQTPRSTRSPARRTSWRGSCGQARAARWTPAVRTGR